MSTWYRPPSANIELLDFFNDFLRKADDENKDIVITGDFNCNFLATEYNEHTAKLDNLLTEYQLQQNIKDPTRITPTSKTLLDIIITKMDDTKTIDSGVLHLGISDHSLVYLCRKVSVPKSKPKIVETRQFKFFDNDYFQQDLIATHLTPRNYIIARMQMLPGIYGKKPFWKLLITMLH